MKKLLPLVLFLVLCTMMVTTTNVTSKIPNPPAGSAGDPASGGSTCTGGGCHSGNDIADSTKWTLGMDTVSSATLPAVFSNVTTYIPGKTYFMSFTNTGTSARYGFQLIAEDNTTNNNTAGTFTATDATHTRLVSGYMGHRNAGSYSTWTFKWTAPATNVGPVTFWCVGMYSNNNGSESGDLVYKFSKTLNPYTAPAVVKPVAAFTANTLSGTTSTVFTLTDQSTNAPTSWQWTCTPANATYVGGTSSTSQNPQVQFSAPGQYTVKLRAANAGGADSITKTAYITVGPNGIDEINSTVSAVKAFPVPMSGNMNVSFDLNEASPVTINLVSLNGEVVKNLYNEKASAGTFNHSFDVSDLTMGVYLLQIKTAGTYINKQVVKL
jgi:PKD repeat protein